MDDAASGSNEDNRRSRRAAPSSTRSTHRPTTAQRRPSVDDLSTTSSSTQASEFLRQRRLWGIAADDTNPNNARVSPGIATDVSAHSFNSFGEVPDTAAIHANDDQTTPNDQTAGGQELAPLPTLQATMDGSREWMPTVEFNPTNNQDNQNLINNQNILQTATAREMDQRIQIAQTQIMVNILRERQSNDGNINRNIQEIATGSRVDEPPRRNSTTTTSNNSSQSLNDQTAVGQTLSNESLVRQNLLLNTLMDTFEEEGASLGERLSLTSLLEIDGMDTGIVSDELQSRSVSSATSRILDVARNFSYTKLGVANDITKSDSIASIVVEKIGSKRLAEWQTTHHDWSRFHNFRQKDLFVDTELICEGESFPCHKVVLSANCEYFRALFEFYAKNKKDASKIYMQNCNPKEVKVIIEFIYNRQATITHENVERLLTTSDEYGVEGLCEHCVAYLGDNLVLENCIGMRTLAIIYQRKYLLHLVDNFIRQNFESIASDSQEFFDLNNYEMVRFLRSDELNVKDETTAFEILIKWIDKDPENRKSILKKALTTMRMGLMDADYFMRKVKKHPLIDGNDALRPIIQEGMKALYDLTKDPKENGSMNPYSRPRLPHEILVAIGGWSGGAPTNVIEAYDNRAGTWRAVTEDMDMSDERPRAYHGVVFWNKYIYIIGGFDGRNYFNSVRKVNVITFKKYEEPPMTSRRCYVSCCISDKTIWAIGGMDGEKRLKTCECFTIGTDRWQVMPDMMEKRSDADSAALNGKIYVVGGFNGHECLNSVEYFCEFTAQWTKITPMESKRSGVSAVTLNDRLYAIGGFDGQNRLRSAEYYSKETNTWRYTGNMINPRSNFGVEVLDKQIIAIGGFNGFQTTYNVEAYDDGNDEWYELPDMHVFRSALNCVTIKKIPMEYIKKYAAPKVDLVGEGSESNNDLFKNLQVATAERNLSQEIIF